MTPLLVSFEAEDLKRLRELSQAGSMPMAAIVRTAVRAHLERIAAFEVALAVACRTNPDLISGLSPAETLVTAAQLGLRAPL